MEELINRIMAAAGIDEGLATNAVGIILGFLNKEGPEDKMQLIFDALPGAQALVEAREENGGGGGLLGGLGSMMGGGMGAMAALNELNSAGLDMDGVQSVAKELISYAKEKAGDDVVDDVVSQIPGLSQIL
ncbi:DUF2780 domain-containing protein [Roseibium porphyridii]|uniref:DUF2780 domain-containing protein n=1 Tax=Roseibium porphyridii TaxID=2866279 RepID=A0ABY8F9I2_9HYPH|nr:MULTISPECIES: DUF2780 domain-containing protein [Stappiaceae]QFT31521.1 hypothetical protein FIV00_13585 [Labrenzia sp. THAF82]WFE92111.1 DUF2780 domain-containing protein [Roseibium sp. KMA01]